MFVSCLRNAAWCGWLLIVAFAAPRATVAAGRALTLQQAVERTLEHNPDLAAFGYEVEAHDGVLRQAGARPNPEVGLLVENALGTGRRSDFDSAETTLSLGFLIERGARERRVDVARAGGEALATEAQIRRLDLAAEAARRFIVVLERQQAFANARAATQLVEGTLEAVRERVRAARVPDAEEARAHAQLSRARLAEEHEEHELASARLRLAALWGASMADFDYAQGDLLALPPLEPFETIRGRIENNADFARLVSLKRVREAELQFAQTRARPPWHMTAGVRWFEDEDDHAFVVGITIPIASRDMAKGAIAQAQARSAQVDAETQALRIRLDAELFALYQDLNHAYTEVAMLRDDVVPRIEAALEQTRYAYERGRYGYVEWVAAQRELLDVRTSLLEALAQLHQFRIEIERLTGTAVGAPVRE